jgi:two-component system LytT family response regulator
MTMKIRTLIVDDEPLARERLRQLLENEPEIQLIGECADGREAITALETQSPDLVFLDVQMPEIDGFGVLQTASITRMPVVVFVTAYDRFALKAFEVHAIDYLLKPFDRQRFQTALWRAVEQVKVRDGGSLAEKQSRLLAELRPAAPRVLEKLAVKTGGRVLFVKLDDIDWVEAAHNYVELHADKQSHLLRETLNSIEGRLPAEKFVRISRSVIVNTSRIKELEPLFYGEYRVTLQNGTKLTLSRRYRDKLPQLGVG